MDKKSKIKAGLSFGILMTIFYIVYGLLTEDNLTTKHIILRIASGIVGGCIAGFIFGLSAGWFGNSKSIMKGTEINLEKDETILFEAPANHFKGIEAVGGKLYLTNNRLVFKSHKFNFQNHEISIALSDIEKVNKYKVLGIANTGLSITTDENKTEKFVVQKREEWMKQLQEKNNLQQVKL